MSQKKMRLNAIHVKSFITDTEGIDAKTIQGGDTEQVNCQTNTVCTLHTIGGDCYQDPGGTYASVDFYMCGPSGYC